MPISLMILAAIVAILMSPFTDSAAIWQPIRLGRVARRVLFYSALLILFASVVQYINR